MDPEGRPRFRLPDATRLAGGRVHVWWAFSDRPPVRSTDLARLLSGDEQARAAEFAFPRDRSRFTVGRGLLRIILGAYLGIDPSAVRLSYGASGKAALPTGRSARPLEFRVAYSEGLVVYAVGQGCRLGIDVERIRPLPEADAIAERFFSPAEAVALRALPPEQKRAAYFEIWTCREAYLKATGAGLTRPARNLPVLVAPRGLPTNVSLCGGRRSGAAWSVLAFGPITGYVAALAREGPRPDLEIRELVADGIRD
jgi:4'-phosphopantetheinyl transferase